MIVKALAKDPGARQQSARQTELVNEVYVRIFGSATPVDWQNRAHFFAVVSQQVRHILVDQARKRRKRRPRFY